MNIVTPFPTNIPINTVNVTTESARRDSQMRDLITKTSATEAGVAERGIASENDKSKPGQAAQTFENNFREADNNQKINERGQGQGGDRGQGGQSEGQQQGRGQSADSQQNGQSNSNQDRAQKLAAEKRRLAEVESKLEQLDLKQIRELKSRDAEVRAHEQAHAAVGGQYAGSPTYTYQKGPDGRNYAVGGEVQIDVSPVAGDPAATVDKMQQVRAAALAPAQPSGQDRKVAASASQAITKALAEQVKQKAAEQEKTQAEQAAQAEQAQANLQGANRAASSEQAGQSEQAQAAQASQAQAIDPFAAEFNAADVVNPSQANPSQEQQAIRAAQAEQAQAQKPSLSRGGQVYADQASGIPRGLRGDQTVAGIFGGEDAQINLNREQAEARNNARANDVLERASRIQNFYADSTKPRETGFTSFA